MFLGRYRPALEAANEMIATIPEELLRTATPPMADWLEGDHASAFAHLRTAVTLDDGLPYDEPWGWMQPARHALGALLLEQGHIEEAAQVYREDLGLDSAISRAHQHPNNVWSLDGYAECLHRLGKHDDAAAARRRLDLAKDMADSNMQASCFCRVGAGG